MKTSEIRGGRFEVRQTLGRGGFGVVVRARDVKTGREVALKELTRVNPDELLRFKREFRVLQQLHHPRLARLDALFEEDDSWFIAMQLVEGTDLLNWIGPCTKLDEARVRKAFAGLAEGVNALHEHGFCHRDIKPANVRVTADGRVVLLDFGLIADVSAKGEPEGEVLGTAAYVAPEQLAGSDYSPASDMYAVGVCLYRALTGRMPFGAARRDEMLERKSAGERPAPPSSVRRGAGPVAEDLERLCVELLDPEPGARPTAAQVWARLSGHATSEVAVPAAFGREIRWAGRDEQIGILDACFAERAAGAQRLVWVQGVSGIGKSALVEEWLRRLESREPALLVLRSRCYENEQVPYKALDGGVDLLASRLRSMSREECRALLPKRAAVLAQLFPVMASVGPIAEAPRDGILADARGRREQGFQALRQLLEALASKLPVVWILDDLQWSDRESFELLQALLDGATGVLFVATVRPPDEVPAEMREALGELADRADTTRLSLGPLSAAEARDLAKHLLEGEPDDELLDAVVRGAGGHPLFIAELSRQGRHEGARELTLEGAVAARVRQVSLPERALLQSIALLERPHGMHLHAQALRGENGLKRSGALDEALAELSARQLVRLRRGEDVECFHDRVRAAVVSLLSGEEKRLRGRALAEALENEGAEPAERARCWELSQDWIRAAGCHEEAGELALSALAFDRAERFFARALELTPSGQGEERLRRMVKQAHALAQGGRSAAAADLFAQSAELAEGDQKLQLGVWAAQHLLQSGQVEAGVRASLAMLAALGVALPADGKKVAVRLLWDRACLSMTSLKAKNENPEIPFHKKLQLQSIYDLALPLVWVDTVRSAALSAIGLRRALRAGDARHLGIALGTEALHRTLQAPDSRAAVRLRAHARELVGQFKEDPLLQSLINAEEGISALVRGQYPAARTALERSARVLQEHIGDEVWLLLMVRTQLARVWYFHGAHLKLAQECEAWMAQMATRNDRFAPAMLHGMGCGFARHLMRDDPDAAAAETRAVMACWPREPFSMVRLGELWATVYTALYAERLDVYEWLNEQIESAQDRTLLKGKAAREAVGYWRTLAALAACANAPSSQLGLWQERVKASLDALTALKTPQSRLWVPLLRAQWLVLQGDRESALEQVAAARATSVEARLFVVHSVAYLEGALIGGERGRQMQQRALSFFQEQGWKSPRRAIAIQVPIVHAL